jgi:hypothetical protein
MSSFSLKRLLLGIAFGVCAMPVQSTIFKVTVENFPEPTSVILSFDLISGGGTASSVTISDFITDGDVGSAVIIDDSNFPTGAAIDGLKTPNDVVTIDESGLLTQFQQQLTLGTFFTFQFSATGDNDGFSPDAFSFLVLNPEGGAYVTTGDKGDSQAIFRYDIGITDPSVSSLFSFSVTGPCVEDNCVTAIVQEASVAVPEPASGLLVLIGILASMVTMRRRVPRML